MMRVTRWSLLIGTLFMVASCVLIPVGTTGTRGPRELAWPDSQWTTLQGVDIHYRVWGAPGYGTVPEPVAGPGKTSERQLIVLLHGFGASTYSWREVAPLLAEYGTVVAYDRPAFGLSGRPTRWKGPNPYSMETQVAILSDLLDNFGAKSAVLIGNSAGGTVAMETALAMPERVRALVLVSPAVYVGGGAPGWVRPLLFLPGINHIGPLVARRLATDGDGFLRSAWYDETRVTPEILKGYRAPLSVSGWEKSLWLFTRSSKPSTLSRRAARISVPVLVVTGDTDRIVPTADSVRLAKEIPGASLVVIPETGHVSHEESPGAFMKAFESFIAAMNPVY